MLFIFYSKALLKETSRCLEGPILCLIPSLCFNQYSRIKTFQKRETAHPLLLLLAKLRKGLHLSGNEPFVTSHTRATGQALWAHWRSEAVLVFNLRRSHGRLISVSRHMWKDRQGLSFATSQTGATKIVSLP